MYRANVWVSFTSVTHTGLTEKRLGYITKHEIKCIYFTFLNEGNKLFGTNHFSAELSPSTKISLRVLEGFCCCCGCCCCCLQYDFPKMRGGGQRPFGAFPKIHPFL